MKTLNRYVKNGIMKHFYCFLSCLGSMEGYICNHFVRISNVNFWFGLRKIYNSIAFLNLFLQ
jgi:hypothetical protein